MFYSKWNGINFQLKCNATCRYSLHWHRKGSIWRVWLVRSAHAKCLKRFSQCDTILFIFRSFCAFCPMLIKFIKDHLIFSCSFRSSMLLVRILLCCESFTRNPVQLSTEFITLIQRHLYTKLFNEFLVNFDSKLFEHKLSNISRWFLK